MFWKKKEDQGLPGPKPVSGIVQKALVEQFKLDAELAPLFKSVTRKGNDSVADIRIFDESEAMAKKVDVKNYTSLDAKPDLILYEGKVNEATKQVTLEEKKKVGWATPIYSEEEIKQKIEALTQPGSTVFFYLARGPGHGGPLAMGATVIELTPPRADGKKTKRFTIYTTDVVDGQPVDKGVKLFDSDKSKEVAAWVKQGHHKRMY